MPFLDREMLERRTCECYSAITAEYGRLLPISPATTVSPGQAPSP
jgi:hypothetical protein